MPDIFPTISVHTAHQVHRGPRIRQREHNDSRIETHRDTMPAVYRPQLEQQEASFRCVEVITVENERYEPKHSIRRIEANRENAQKSTGPKTAQGKHNSSRNATNHGLLSKELVIEHLTEMDTTMPNILRLVKPGGLLRA